MSIIGLISIGVICFIVFLGLGLFIAKKLFGNKEVKEEQVFEN